MDRRRRTNHLRRHPVAAPDKGPLQAAVTRDSLKAAFDDAVEVFVDPMPEAADRVNYQFLVNSLGKGGYRIHTSGSPAEESNWSGNWRHAHGLHDGWWHFECAIPAASMKMAGAGRKTTEGVWQMNLCRDWKPDWAWSSLVPGGYEKSGLRVRLHEGARPSSPVHPRRRSDVSAFAGKTGDAEPVGAAVGR